MDCWRACSASPGRRLLRAWTAWSSIMPTRPVDVARSATSASWPGLGGNMPIIRM